MAPGDFVSSPKIVEFAVAGGLGGCIPVIVVSGEAANMLPYARWLDWCSIAYMVKEKTAVRHMDRVLAQLANVSAHAAEAKRRALEAVLGAFVFKEPTQPRVSANCAEGLDSCTALAADSRQAGLAGPLKSARFSWGAADFLLAEACASSQRLRQGLSLESTDAWPGSSESLRRCFIR
mmetsp:Transcript_59626/g.129269  ORF Transcript_59626/g.129269 Transcript_59626/m.129269 type:complete len:178 (-) Transcript_59626:51-584(-)